MSINIGPGPLNAVHIDSSDIDQVYVEGDLVWERDEESATPKPPTTTPQPPGSPV